MYDDIIASLKQHKGSYKKIAEDTGLDYHWLHQVSSGRIGDPGIKKMETLKFHLDSLSDQAKESA